MSDYEEIPVPVGIISIDDVHECEATRPGDDCLHSVTFDVGPGDADICSRTLTGQEFVDMCFRNGLSHEIKKHFYYLLTDEERFRVLRYKQNRHNIEELRQLLVEVARTAQTVSCEGSVVPPDVVTLVVRAMRELEDIAPPREEWHRYESDDE